MINLFHINSHIIDTSNFKSLLHDECVTELEQKISSYVGAKYAVGLNSATSAIFLSLLDRNIVVSIPSIIPPVVLNAIKTSRNHYQFIDDVKWVGNSYILHDFISYKIIDSAQQLKKDQFKKECNPNDLMIFSFYPTKPIGSCDGGMIVSNDPIKIQTLRQLAFNGMSFSQNNWDRQIKSHGYKMYMNSIQANIALRNFLTHEKKLLRLKEIKDEYNEAFGLNNISDHLYRINVSNRNEFVIKMRADEIMTGIHYRAAHQIELYRSDTLLPLSEKEGETTISIPFHENLSTKEISYVIRKVKKHER